jgi:ribosome-binding protein aMBF1 (putative translation factor)
MTPLRLPPAVGSFGEAIAYARAARGMSPEALGDRIAMTAATLGEIERGELRTTGMAGVFAIVLGVDEGDLESLEGAAVQAVDGTQNRTEDRPLKRVFQALWPRRERGGGTP